MNICMYVCMYEYVCHMITTIQYTVQCTGALGRYLLMYFYIVFSHSIEVNSEFVLHIMYAESDLFHYLHIYID